jgi:MiaB/RimO family radical SAM methylthiotransferase
LKSRIENIKKYTFDDVAVKHADCVIFNTCAFTESAADLSCEIITQMKGLIKENSELIVCGCLPKTNPEKLQKIFRGFTFSWGEFNRLKEHFHFDVDDRNLTKISDDRLETWNVRIAYGCAGDCSYCADKTAIGSITSRHPQEIIQEIKTGLEKGYKEILLSAHDSGAYGLDIGYSLPQLLRKVLEIDHSFNIHIDCINPQHLKRHLDELIEIYRDERIVNFLYAPLQTGSDKILKNMKRNYTVQDFEDCLKKFKKKIPSIEFGTDIIVGFPGETEEDFRETLRIIASFSFKLINIFSYSKRPNTEAASLPDQIPEKIKKERRKKANRLWEKILSIEKKLSSI